MEDLKLEAENRLRASRHRRRAEALAWMEQARKEMAEHADLRRELASTPAGDKVIAKKREVKVTLSKVSLEWREAHKKEKCGFLFPEVFPLLFQCGHLEIEDVLKFRLMSKQSKDSVDLHLSKITQPLLYSKDENNVECLVALPLPVPVIDSHDVVAIFNYWSWISYSGQNPFFSRHLLIGGEKDEPGPLWKDNQEFWRGIENLLRRWGTQIWHVMIHFDKGMTPKEIYQQLNKLLTLMPNLRSINLEDHNRPDPDPRFELSTPGPLKEEMRRCPLLELPHLTSIFFDPRVPAPIIHAVLTKYNGSLEEINGDFVPDGPGHSLSVEPLKMFRTLSNCAPPAKFEGPFGSLVHLSLDIDVREASAIPEIFKNVNDCGPSVRRLDLAMENLLVPTVELTEPILKSLSLELPNLESFRFFASRVNLNNIDFLLPCRSLKQILLRYSKRADFKKETKAGPSIPAPAPPVEVIQFTGYANRLYESNIWELFPDLELVSIEDATSSAAGPHFAPTMPDPLTLNTCFDTKVKLYSREGFRKRQLKKD